VEAVRDVAIIVLAVESIVIGVVLILTLLELRSLGRTLKRQVGPMLVSASQTVDIVRGTANFVTDSVVRPVFTVATFIARIRRILQLVLRRGRAGV